MRLIGDLDVQEPVGAGALGVLIEDRVQDVAVEHIGRLAVGEVDQVVAERFVVRVVAQAVELVDVLAHGEHRVLAALDAAAVVPADHDAHDERGHQDGEVAAMEELGEGGHEEEALKRDEEDDEGPGEDLHLAHAVQVEEEQHGGADHRDGDGQAVGGLHVSGALEQQHDDNAADPHDVVDHGDVELALGLGGVEDLHVGHEVEAAGLGHERERAGHERLACDDRGAGGEDDAERTDHLGQHLEERVEVLDEGELGVAGVGEQPSALAEVGQDEADLDEGPSGVDVAAADVAHVGVEGLGTGGGEEAATQDHDASMVVGRQQEADAAQRVEREQDNRVAEYVDEPRAAEEQEPKRHDRAEGMADLGSAHALHREQQAHDDERDDHDVHLVVAHDVVHGGDGAQALDGRGDGHRRGEDAVGQKRGAAEHGGHDQPFAVFAHDAVEREDAALAVVVGLEGDEHVLDGGQQRDRPDDERERAEDELLGHGHDAALACKQRLGDVHGRRADVAVHDAQGDEHRADAYRDRGRTVPVLG
ncbi:Uncharacterised protein [Collinsella intestinalis]|nr:Uncharacterised protein [Collinsella intestinalis]